MLEKSNKQSSKQNGVHYLSAGKQMPVIHNQECGV